MASRRKYRWLGWAAGLAAALIVAYLAFAVWWVGSDSIRGEAAALADCRTVISAQAGYQMANQGYYEGRLECLATPWECIPGYPEDGPRFLDEATASLEDKDNYAREFFPGAPADVSLEGSSPSSVEGYAYVTIPLVPEGYDNRAFCADDSGITCFTPKGVRPLVENGHCVVEGSTSREVPQPWRFERLFPTPPSSRPCRVLQ